MQDVSCFQHVVCLRHKGSEESFVRPVERQHFYCPEDIRITVSWKGVINYSIKVKLQNQINYFKKENKLLLQRVKKKQCFLIKRKQLDNTGRQREEQLLFYVNDYMQAFKVRIQGTGKLDLQCARVIITSGLWWRILALQ